MQNTSNLFYGSWKCYHKMINCDQFIYTAAKTKREKGYQVIAKSDGVSEGILSELRNYFYPSGIKHSQFKESRSLLFLKNNKIAFSIIKNIGTGFDGRPDAIYNHTIILTKDDFKKILNDTRVLENYYLENSKKIGHLPIVSISIKKIPIDFKFWRRNQEILSKIMLTLFKEDKIAIFGNDDHKIIQNLFSLIPPSMRLISFSSLVDVPDRQPNYNFFLTKKHRIPNLDEKFVKIIVNGKTSGNRGKSQIENSVYYLTDIINNEDENLFNKIYRQFEDLRGTDVKSKLILVTNYEQFLTTHDEKLKREYADNIFEVIKKIDKDTASKYLNKIKKYSKRYTLLEDQLQNYINPSISLLDAMVILPAKVAADMFASYVEFQKRIHKYIK